MKATILGTGTSTGVPIPGCRCSVCSSNNPRNNRLRTSALLEFGKEGSVLIDSSPDLRQQSLRAGISQVSAVLYTHTHADHVFGIDDLRSFNFIQKSIIPVYASEESAAYLLDKFRYCFIQDPNYEGGSPPRLQLNHIRAYEPLDLGYANILPLLVYHGSMEVLAFRVGHFAYVTDCSKLPERTIELLQGLDVLILDGLRERPHKTHFNLEGAVAAVEVLRPKKTYLTHISHELDHEIGNARLRSLTDCAVELGYDGLEISL